LSRNPSLISEINRNNVQRLDLDPSSPVKAYDFLDLFEKHLPSEELMPLKSAVSKAVIFKANTPTFLGKPITNFSGLSSYIPAQEESHLFPFYRTLNWYLDAGYDSLF